MGHLALGRVLSGQVVLVWEGQTSRAELLLQGEGGASWPPGGTALPAWR